MTVSVGCFTQNSLSWVKMTVSKTLLWADQICILDMNSSDGTEEYCKSVFRPQDVYVKVNRNIIPLFGYDVSHNIILNLSNCDWSHVSGINVCLDWRQSELIRKTISETSNPVLSIYTKHIPLPDFAESEWPNHMEEMLEKVPSCSERHRNFIRKNSGIVFKGYQHEEPFLGEINAGGLAETTEIQRFHYGNWIHLDRNLRRKSWMYKRALQIPELQKYTSKWWYDVYCKEHAAEIEQKAFEFEKLYPEDIKGQL